MEGLIVIVVLALGTWQTCATFRRLRHCHAGCPWWLAFGVLGMAGVALGIWFAFYFEYQPTATMRVQGFPVPLVLFAWEEDRWTDFVPRSEVMYPVCAANVVATIALVLLPVFLLSLLVHREKIREPK